MRYLDTDRDGFVWHTVWVDTLSGLCLRLGESAEVSREEFELGFSGGKVKSREAVQAMLMPLA